MLPECRVRFEALTAPPYQDFRWTLIRGWSSLSHDSGISSACRREFNRQISRLENCKLWHLPGKFASACASESWSESAETPSINKFGTNDQRRLSNRLCSYQWRGKAPWHNNRTLLVLPPGNAAYTCASPWREAKSSAQRVSVKLDVSKTNVKLQ